MNFSIQPFLKTLKNISNKLNVKKDGFDIIENTNNINKNKLVNIKKIKEKELGLTALKEFEDLLNSIEFVNVGYEIITIENDDLFVKRQHEILEEFYIVVELKDNILKIVTENKKIFNIELDKVSEHIYKTIFTAYIPRKICINSKELFKFAKTINNVYDIQLIIKLFYGKEVNSVKEILNMFMKNISDDENLMLYNLLIIKDKLNIVLERNLLMKLINKEFKIIEILSSCEEIGVPIDSEKYNKYISDVKFKLKALMDDFEIRYGTRFTTKEDLLRIFDKYNIPLTLNVDILKSVSEDNFLVDLVKAFKDYNKIKENRFNLKDNRLYIKYNSYNDFGNISSNLCLDNAYIKSDKYIVTGYYQDLYFRVFLNSINDKKLIESMNKGTFYDDLAFKIFNTSNEIAKFNSIALLDGFIQGFTTVESMGEFIYEKYDTYISDEGIEKLLYQFINNCDDLIQKMIEFKRIRSTEKRYSFVDTTNIHKFVKLTESDIYKYALTLVYDKINEFNSTHKSKINLIGFINNQILLETEEKNLNIAIDILNRELPRAFNHYIKKVKPKTVTLSSK